LSVQGMDVAGIAKVTFTSPDRVREVLNNFNDDGFDSLYPVLRADPDETRRAPVHRQPVLAWRAGRFRIEIVRAGSLRIYELHPKTTN
jgi:hypothetical protein